MNNNKVISFVVMLFTVSIISSQSPYDMTERFYGGNQLTMAGGAMPGIPQGPVLPAMPAMPPYYQNAMPRAYPERRSSYQGMPYPMVAPNPVRAFKDGYANKNPIGIQLVQNYNP